MRKDTEEWYRRLGGKLTRHGTDRASSSVDVNASPDARAPDEDPIDGAREDGADGVREAGDKAMEEAESKGAYGDGSAGELGKSLYDRAGKYADARADVEAIAAKARAVPWRQLPHMAWLGICGAVAIVGGFYGVGWMTNHPTATPLSIAERTSRVFEQRQKTQQELARQQAALQVLGELTHNDGSQPIADVSISQALQQTNVNLVTAQAPPAMVPAPAFIARFPATQQAQVAHVILAARAQGRSVTFTARGSRGDSGSGGSRGGLDLPGGISGGPTFGTFSLN